MIETLEKKHMMTTDEMIEHLKNKNIKFNKMSEAEAKNYLKYNNNYYNITSYRNNFERYYIKGEFVDKYIDLDFGYLKDLSIIDYKLRLILFNMVISIEHYLKLRILNMIEGIDREDGYRIVNIYLKKDYNDKENPKRLHNSIFRKTGSEYYQKIFLKYDLDKNKQLENIPIWEFLEMITFGELVRFYEFFIDEYNLKYIYNDIFIFTEIVKLRNAVAHNTNLLSELNIKNNKYPPERKITQYLEECGLKKDSRKKLTNSRIRQITYTLYMFNEAVTSVGIKDKMKEEIRELFYIRIKSNKEYYTNNELLKSIYYYFSKIIEKYY